MLKIRKKIIAIVLTGILFLSSCFNPNNEEAISKSQFNRVEIDEIDSVDSLVAKEVIKEYQIIKLETNPNSLISDIHKVRFIADKIFVLDISKAKNIFVFNNKGKHLYNIGHIGQGPGEYLQPMDIAIDTVNKELIVYDQASKKLITYNFLGEFKNEHRINLFFRSIEYIDSSTILGFSHNMLNIGNDYKEYPYDLFVFNKDGVVSKSYLFNNTKVGKSTSIFTKNRYFARNGDNIFVSYLLNDTIYSLEKGYRPVPKYVLDFGDKKIETTDFDDQDKLLEQLVAGERSGIWRPISVTNNNMLISFTKGIDVNNPEENQRVLIQFPDKYTRFKSISFEDLKWSFPIATKEEYFVSSISPERIGTKLGNEIGIQEGDNPALLLYNFKQSK